MDDELTKAEERWIQRLERVLDSMPPNLYLSVKAYGIIDVCRPDVIQQHFAENGDVDNALYLHTIHSVNQSRIAPNSESV